MNSVVPIAAPAALGAAVGAAPVYHSQIFVRNDSRFKCFEDLRGAVFAYNDDTSLSGYYCMQFFLLAYNLHSGLEARPFFSKAFKTGAHVNSLCAVLEGRADVLAVDCTVMKTLQLREEWQEKLSHMRSIKVPDLFQPIGNDGAAYRVSDNGLLGPHPAQPVVVSRHVDSFIMDALRAALLGLPREALQRIQAERYMAVDESYYKSVVAMIHLCEGKHLLV